MGKTVYLYFGRGKGYEGFWVAEKQIPSPLRKRDRFLEYLRKHLAGARLLGIEMDPEDRIIYIKYQKFGKECTLALFYKGRHLYFANEFYDQKAGMMNILCSWDAKLEVSSIDEAMTLAGRTVQNNEPKSKSIPQAHELIQAEEKQAFGGGEGKKKKNFLKRKFKNISKDLEQTRKWQVLKQWIESRQDFDTLDKKIEIDSIKINFRESTSFKRRDELYTKVKKLKKGQSILEKRLEEVERIISSKPNQDEYENTLSVIQPTWSVNKKQVASKKLNDELGYYTVDHDVISIGVGTGAQGNDQLRKSWASKDDWWFHLDSETSPHIIVKLKSKALDAEVFEMVALEMRKSAHITTPELNLVYTQVKNLKGIKKRPGAVIFKKEKRIRVYVEDL